MRKKFGAVAVN